MGENAKQWNICPAKKAFTLRGDTNGSMKNPRSSKGPGPFSTFTHEFDKWLITHGSDYIDEFFMYFSCRLHSVTHNHTIWLKTNAVVFHTPAPFPYKPLKFSLDKYRVCNPFSLFPSSSHHYRRAGAPSRTQWRTGGRTKSIGFNGRLSTSAERNAKARKFPIFWPRSLNRSFLGRQLCVDSQ